jgi:hypothetical protein
VASGNLGFALKAGFISMVTTFVVQNVVSDITGGGGGINGAGSVGDAWGPPMRLNGPIVPGASSDGTSLDAVIGTGGSPASSSLHVPVPSPVPAAVGGMDLGQSLLLGGIGAAVSLSGSWQNNGTWQSPSSRPEIRASDYLQRAVNPCPFPNRALPGPTESPKGSMTYFALAAVSAVDVACKPQ